MKPFDLELAKQGKPVCTKNGIPVKILDFNFEDRNFSIVAKWNDGNDDHIEYYTKEGNYYKSGTPSTKDLCMASVKKEGWVNVYCYTEKTYDTGAVFETKEEAENEALKGKVATVKITWEE